MLLNLLWGAGALGSPSCLAGRYGRKETMSLLRGLEVMARNPALRELALRRAA